MIGIMKTLASIGKETMTPTERLLVVSIYSMTNQDGIAWPGIDFLGRVAGISDPRHVRRTLRKLEDLGILTSSPRFSETGRQTSNEYTLHEDVLLNVEKTEVPGGGGSTHPGGGGSTHPPL